MMRKTPIKSSSTLKNKTQLKRGESTLSTNSTLKKSKPLKAKSSLKSASTLSSKSTLKTNSVLKSKSTLDTKTPLKTNTSIKSKQVGAKKTEGAYFSIFTGSNMSVCAITGDKSKKNLHVDVHHIFAGPYKAASEKRGFVIPLRHDYHVGTNYAIHEDRSFSESVKYACAKYYVENGLGTKEDFIKEFGRWPQDVKHPLVKAIGTEKRIKLVN